MSPMLNPTSSTLHIYEPPRRGLETGTVTRPAVVFVWSIEPNLRLALPLPAPVYSKSTVNMGSGRLGSKRSMKVAWAGTAVKVRRASRYGEAESGTDLHYFGSS